MDPVPAVGVFTRFYDPEVGEFGVALLDELGTTFELFLEGAVVLADVEGQRDHVEELFVYEAAVMG